MDHRLRNDKGSRLRLEPAGHRPQAGRPACASAERTESGGQCCDACHDVCPCRAPESLS